MSFILVTNDDGIDSPAIPALVRALAAIADRVEVVVPDGERSWIGKAVSRHGSLHVRDVRLGDLAVKTVSGTPADCTQLGLHNLFDATPDMVVSGINIGSNYGSAYTVGSGTVGGALEAAIGGVNAVALSACSGPRNWATWSTFMASQESAGAWEPLAAIGAEVVADVLAHGMHCDVLSVNMPEDATIDTPRTVVPLAPTRYGRLFVQRSDGTYGHDWESDLHVPSGATDGDFPTVMAGAVSIVPLQIASMTADFADLPRRLSR